MNSYKIESMTSETIATSSYWAAIYADQEDNAAPSLRCVVEPADSISWVQSSACEMVLAVGHLQFHMEDKVCFSPVRLSAGVGLSVGDRDLFPLANRPELVDRNGLLHDCDGVALERFARIPLSDVEAAKRLGAHRDRQQADAEARSLLTPVTCPCSACAGLP